MKEELFLYFTTDNISGKKCTEKWLSKNNYGIYQSVINWCDEINILKNIEFKRKVYHFIYDLKEIPNCLSCGGESPYFRIRDGYRQYCSKKCVGQSSLYHEKWISSWKKNNSNGESIIKRQETAKNKYGNIENYKIVMKNNYENSMMNKYGVKSIFESEEFKNNRKKILKEKYGSENYNNSDKTRNTRIKNGSQIDDDLVSDFESYRKVVINRTMTIYRNNENIINPDKLKRGKKLFHIDHKFSIKQGYLNNIPIEILTHPCNLHLIHYQDNLEKQDNCCIEIRDLLLNISKSKIDLGLNHSILREKYNNIQSLALSLLDEFVN